VAPAIAIPAVLMLGALFGAMMGWLIHTLKIPAFIITLAGMFFLRGASFLMSEQSLPIDHPVFHSLSRMSWKVVGGGRLSLLAVIMLVVVAAGMLIAHRTRFGNNVYAIGGNTTSAELMGVPVKQTTIGIYTLSTLIASIAGVVFSIYTSAGYPLAAVGVELDVIAAVVIGGTLLSGGVGTVFGSMFGVLIQGLIQTYITFDGSLSSWWTKIIIGILLFSFIGLQRLLIIFTRKQRVKANLSVQS
ncbi:galactofuranose ABC transporter, permease protein YjfF, partial [Vibrio sp. V10_P2A27P122]